MAIEGRSKIQVIERRDGEDVAHQVQYGQVSSPKGAMNRFRAATGVDPKVRLEVSGISYTGQDLAHYEFYFKESGNYAGSMEVTDNVRDI